MTGVCGSLLLLIVPLADKIIGPSGNLPGGNYLWWALPVSLVALAEEAFLRGVLFDALTNWRGSRIAILGAAALFALLHVPLYGWHVVPLDFVVGIWFGELRLIGKSWVAPGIAHTFADLFSWWLI